MRCVLWQILFVVVVCLGLAPFLSGLLFSFDETQIWLGDLRVVVVVGPGLSFGFACFYGPTVSLYKCLSDSLFSCKDRASERHRPNAEKKRFN